MTEKRYVRILDHYEKEVRVFDEHNQKNIFNIFFEELDSAICLKGALEDTVDLLNYFYEEKKELQFQCNLLREQANEFHRGARENANRVRQLEKENKTLKSALKELKEIGDYQEMRIRELSDETNM